MLTLEPMRPIKKVIYSLVINDYEPAIRALTFPLLQAWAKKIGAEVQLITERKFPDWPVTYEKLQVSQFAAENQADWHIFIDADALVNPELFDITAHLSKDTVMHNGKDMNGVRWKMNEWFLRDGRWIGSCNWLCIGSDWCAQDLWRPLDKPLSWALDQIQVTNAEYASGHCEQAHLIDDFTMSCNIARHGLKYTTLNELCGKLGWKQPRTFEDAKGTIHVWGDAQDISPFFLHLYNCDKDTKIKAMLDILTRPTKAGGWALMKQEEAQAFLLKWGIK